MDKEEIVPMTPKPVIPREPGQSLTMDFPDAMREIIKGNKVRRFEWPTETDYCLLKDGLLKIYTKDAFHIWTINDGDMQGQDWIVLKEINATTN